MTQRSFERANYALRPNKCAERKIILDCLALLQDEFPIRDYRYVGFGSVWFIDFIIFHKTFRMRDMISLEREKSRKQRVAFNKPYNCIQIRMDHSTDVLPTLAWNKRTILWLDYDDVLEKHFFADIDTFCRLAPSGSALIVTSNAHLGQVYPVYEHEQLQDPVSLLREVAGDFVPSDAANRITGAYFPGLVAETLLAAAQSASLSRPDNFSAQTLFNIGYSDGVPMVTIGVMIVNEEDRHKLDQIGIANHASYLGASDQFWIDLPHLTQKEKLALDALLPSDKSLKVADLPFELRPAELDSYAKFYRFYPVFAEFQP